MRVWDALFGGLAFLYVFAFGRRLAGPDLRLRGGVRALRLRAAALRARPAKQQHGGAARPLLLRRRLPLPGVGDGARSPARRRGHVVAVTLYFFLGLHDEVRGGALSAGAPGRGRRCCMARRDRALFGEWKLWAAGAGALRRCSRRRGSSISRSSPARSSGAIMLGAHVVERFTVSIDPSHIQPWNYYFVTIFHEMFRTGTIWLALGGGVLAAHQARARATPRRSGWSSPGSCCRWRSCRSERRRSITTRTRFCRRWRWPPATVPDGSRSPAATRSMR